MARKAPGSIDEAIDNFVADVRKATLNSIVSITPPGDRYEKSNGKGSLYKQRAKAGLERLKKEILERFGFVDEAVPVGGDKMIVIHEEDRGTTPPTHLYLLREPHGGGGKRQPNTIPVLSSAAEIENWIRKNQFFNASGQGRVRKQSRAFYTSTAAYLRAGKEIAKNAGFFMAGWWRFYEAFGTKMPSGLAPASALKKAKAHNVSYVAGKADDDRITGENAAQEGNRPLENYAQRLLNTEIPKTTEYYQKKMSPILERTLQKHFDFDRSQAKSLSKTIQIIL